MGPQSGDAVKQMIEHATQLHHGNAIMLDRRSYVAAGRVREYSPNPGPAEYDLESRAERGAACGDSFAIDLSRSARCWVRVPAARVPGSQCGIGGLREWYSAGGFRRPEVVRAQLLKL